MNLTPAKLACLILHFETGPSEILRGISLPRPSFCSIQPRISYSIDKILDTRARSRWRSFGIGQTSSSALTAYQQHALGKFQFKFKFEWMSQYDIVSFLLFRVDKMAPNQNGMVAKSTSDESTESSLTSQTNRIIVSPHILFKVALISWINHFVFNRSQKDRPNSNPYDTKPGEKPYELELVWRNIIGFIVLHSIAVYALLFVTAQRSSWVIGELREASTNSQSLHGLSTLQVQFLQSPARMAFLPVLIDFGLTSATKRTWKWRSCCCSSKPSPSRTASSNGSATIAFTTSSVTQMLILITPAAGSSSHTWDGSCARNIPTWESTDRESTWPTWSPKRFSGSSRSECATVLPSFTPH